MTVHAEDMPVYTLDQVVVTANREPEKVIDSNADISVVTAKDIEANHYKSVADAVKQVPGVVIATRGSSSQTYFSDPITINGSTNVVVMVDGMRVNTNGLMGTHSQLGILTNMDSVDHIEVLKGSASTLYGSDAAGGVINIITKKPTDGEVHTTLDLSRASFDGEKYGLYNEGNKDGFFWTSKQINRSRAISRTAGNAMSSTISMQNPSQARSAMTWAMTLPSHYPMKNTMPTTPVLTMDPMIRQKTLARRTVTASHSSTMRASMTA